MVLAELNGGLGNQLFQYAAAKSLALHHKCGLKLDTRFFTETKKSFDLCYFNIRDEIATDAELSPFLNRTLFKKINDRIKPPHKRTVYREPFFHYDNHFFQASRNVYLKGLWQSEKYFKPFENEIRKNLEIDVKFTGHLGSLQHTLHTRNSVSVHIRRGDYLTPIAQHVLGLLPLEYYYKAISIIASKIDNPFFYFFSDDIEWVKSNFAINYPHRFASNQLSNMFLEDFYLMSQCRHNIIANSSFSWWAAWLNKNPGKEIIAPEKWFNKASFNTKDLIPGNWMLI